MKQQLTFATCLYQDKLAAAHSLSHFIKHLPPLNVELFKASPFVQAVATAVSAQDSAMAPAPSMDNGAAFSLPVSGVAVMFSLITSLLALLKQ
ncbi:hypothetical protein V6N13_140912 [Hibiscus sabdariffa]